MNRLRSLLKINPDETQPFLLMLLLSFLVGGGVVFTNTSANALFVTEFGAASIPYAYLISAVVVGLLGFAYARLQSHLPVRSLVSAMLLLLTIAVLSIRVGLALTGNRWFVFAALPLYRNTMTFAELTFWLVAGTLFTIRQGKRLYGPISTGAILARILGYLLTPLVVAQIGSANLLYLSALLFAGAWLLAVYIMRRGAGMGVSAEMPTSNLQETPAQPSAGRYLFLIYALYGIGSIGYYLISFNFYTAAGLRYPDADQLASFIGLFTGIISACVLVGKIFVAGRLMQRIGLVTTMLLRPVGTLLLTIGMLALALNPSGNTAALTALAIGIRFFDLLFYDSLYRPGTSLLYQPLAQTVRAKVQSLNEGVIGAGSLVLAGGLLILVGPERIVFNTSLLVGITFTWVMILVALRSEYVQALRRALSQRWLSGGELDLRDPASLAVVQTKLSSPHPNEVVYALELMARDHQQLVDDALPSLLTHSEPLVRQEAIRRITQQNSVALHPVLQTVARTDPDLATQALAVQTLARDGGVNALVFTEIANPELRHAALLGQLQSEAVQARAAAHQMLAQLASGNSLERLQAATLLASVPTAVNANLLLPLLDDGDSAVRHAAVEAAHHLEEARPHLFANMADPQLGAAARRALANIGDGLLPVLTARFEVATDASHQRAMIDIAAQINSSQSASWLASLLPTIDRPLQPALVAALNRVRFVSKDASVTAHALQRTLADAARVQVLLGKMNSAEFPTLHTALGNLLIAQQQQLLHLLGFTHGRSPMRNIRDALQVNSAEKRAFALELLDVALPTALKATVLPLFQPTVPFNETTDADTLSQIVTNNGQHLGDWVRACTLYAIGEKRITSLAPQVAAAQQEHVGLVHSTAAWAHAQLLAKAYRPEENPMLLPIEKIFILRTVDLFSATPDDTLVQVAELLDEVSLAPGETIFNKGDVGDSMYIIVSGKVRAHDGAQTFNYLGERSVFGEMALLDPEPRVASITAEEPTLLLALHKAPLDELMETRPEVARGFIRVLARHLRARVADLTSLRRLDE